MKPALTKSTFFTLIVLLLAVTSVFVQAKSTASSSTAAVNSAYTIVDTAQSSCYNGSGVRITCPTADQPTYGQDAQYNGNQPDYTRNTDGTIRDPITGLIWQPGPDTNGDEKIDATDKKTYTQAQAYCQDLTLAGFTDWQLPNIKQLYSLINFNGTDPSGLTSSGTSGLTPFIDTDYFSFAYGDVAAGERIIDAQYASSTLYVSSLTEQKLFGVNFADGRIKGYGLQLFGTDKTFFVLCVRGNTAYGTNDFVANGDGTVTDRATGLMWSQADSETALNWEAALEWVQVQNAASYLGHNDWRLPDAKELQSILDYTRSPDTSGSAAIDPIFDATTLINEGGQADWPWYWTSTTHVTSNGMGASAVYIAFGRAGGWQKATPNATCYTFYDVHGAGAQRSDPKTSRGLVNLGTACNGGTASGLGPQGDIQRAANYVRLVRDDDSAIATQDHRIHLPLIRL